MYYMKYTSTITSKGTITIAAPLRHALGYKPGQKVTLSLDNTHKIIISNGVSFADFEKIRNQLVTKVPDHKKGLTGRLLKDATAMAWTTKKSE